MTRRSPLVHNEPAHISPRKTSSSAAHAVRAALLVIAATAFVGVAHADVDVSDSKAQDRLDDIKDRLGDGNLNRTTSDLLKEIRTSIPKLDFASTLTPNNQLKKITDTAAYVKQACPSKGVAGAIAGAADALGLGGIGGSSQNITTLTTISSKGGEKQKICEQIIQLRVQSFNDTIDMSDRFQKYSEYLTSIDNNRQSAKTQGDLWANTNEALRTMNKLQAEMSFWRTRLAAYEAAIKFHEGQQNALSQTAIKGSGGGLPNAQDLVKAGALAAALAISK